MKIRIRARVVVGFAEGRLEPAASLLLILICSSLAALKLMMAAAVAHNRLELIK